MHSTAGAEREYPFLLDQASSAILRVFECDPGAGDVVRGFEGRLEADIYMGTLNPILAR